MQMDRILICVFLLLCCGQYSFCQQTHTFEGMLLEQKMKLAQIPLINAVNERLASAIHSPDVFNALLKASNTDNFLESANVSSKCETSVKYAVENINGNWTKTMLDAMAKPPAAIQYGALNWIGGFELCMANPPPHSDKGSRSHYCRATLGIPSTNLLAQALNINIGLCLPETCSAKDIENLIRYAILEVSHIFPNNSQLPALAKEESVYCWKRQNEMELSGGAIAMIVISSIFGLLLLCGTSYDIIVVRFYRQRPVASTRAKSINISTMDGSLHENRLSNGNSIPAMMDDNAEDGFNYQNINEVDPAKPIIPPEQLSQELRAWEKALIAFSVYSNALKILETKQEPGRLNCLDGIRFLSMSWVILGHTYFFATAYVNNMGYMLPKLQSFSYQAISNATFSVDSFFALSGLLTAYMFLKEANRMGTIINGKFWLLYYFHRFWRLTPPYMLFLGFYTALYTYMSNGPMWSQVNGIDGPNCRSYWWTNLLYINNVVDSSKMCMGWSWYLSNDMQFHYFIAPIVVSLIFLASRSPRHVVYVVGGAAAPLCYILASLTVTGVESSVNKYPPGTSLLDFDTIYIKPWCRASAYVAGLVTGALILQHQKRNWKLHPAIVVSGWLIAAGLCVSVLYGLTDVKSGMNADGSHVLSNGASALYNATSRFAWSAGLCWLIYACVVGYGGWINQILSWSGFIPLSRLTYCAYLVHPVVMVFCYQSLQSSPFVETLTMVYWYFGHMVAAYMVAFVLSVSCESPLIGLERILLKKH